MSQSGVINVSSSTPSMPTSFVTDVNSPAVPAANILNLLASDSTDNNVNGIQTDGSSGSNTLTVELTNRLQGTGTAAGAVTSDLITFTLDSSARCYEFEFIIAGRETTTGDSVGYKLFTAASTDGATASLTSGFWVDSREAAALLTASMAVVVSGNNVVLQATGVAGLTISYSAVGSYVQV